MMRLMRMRASSVVCWYSKYMRQHHRGFVSSGKRWPCVSFSGAGFLTAYHIGVVQCLLDHGLVLPPNQLPPKGTYPGWMGVSGGAVVSSAIAVGVSPEEGMEAVLRVASKTQDQWLDCLSPGFSLVDHLAEVFQPLLLKALGGTGDVEDGYDADLLKRRLQATSLRIGVTDRRVFPPFLQNPSAFRIISFPPFQEEDGSPTKLEDILAACLASCYVPGLTGPLMGTQYEPNNNKRHWVRWMHNRLVKMTQRNQVQPYHLDHDATMQPHQKNPTTTTTTNGEREWYWDGGLTNLFPVMDDDTLLVTPMTARLHPNPYISPALDHPEERNAVTIRVNARTEILVRPQNNLVRVRRMLFSSNPDVLHQMHAQGYDHARYV
mmetsp:Transcript_31719/g.72862  ORF Transcript_31719/g.72862 Transcript_31719/m.72862 type:complete len:377 (-) Transcript_31719:178-1308(-)